MNKLIQQQTFKKQQKQKNQQQLQKLIKNKMLTFYQQRLQNLSTIILDLHKIVKNDEVVSHLCDPALEKYRIDRINQIVMEVMNSQKQRMLIRVLEKYQQISVKLKQEIIQLREKQEQSQVSNVNKNKQPNYFQNWISVKQKSQIQIGKLTNLLNQKNQQIQRTNKEIIILKQKIKIVQKSQVKLIQPCLNCQKLLQKQSQYEQQLHTKNQFIEKLKKDGENALKILNQKIIIFNQRNSQLQNQLIQKSSTAISQPQTNFSQKNETARRTQKIQIMRRQISFLQQQLIQVQKKFDIIKDLALGNITGSIKKLKNQNKKLKQYIYQIIKSFSQQLKIMNQKIAQKLIKSEIKNNTNSIKPQKLVSKLNQLQNELDYFLENQIYVE